jgi:HPt (histidine-containing phosphotransfer) domain-containing protein
MEGNGLVDLARVSRLEEQLGAGLEQIVGSLVFSMSAQIEKIQRALGAGRPEEAAQPAHSCRNDALMVGAKPLLAALLDVESASRAGRLQPAREGLEALLAVWPQTRDELRRLAGDAPAVRCRRRPWPPRIEDGETRTP